MADQQEDLSPTTLPKHLKFKPRIGLLSGISILLGSVMGTGIFISPRHVLKHTESVEASLIVWSLGGVISILGALSFAEIGVRLPYSGGEYVYTLKMFKQFNSKFAKLPAFLNAWVTLGLIHPLGLSIFARIFSQYILAIPFDRCDVTDEDYYHYNLSVNLIAGFAISTVTLINCLSVRASTFLINIFAVLKVLALLLIVCIGFVKIHEGETEYLKPDLSSASKSVGQWSSAILASLYAFSGWNKLNFVVEEMKNLHRNLPLCAIIALVLTTTLYVLTNVAYLTVLSPEEIINSRVVAVEFADRTIGRFSWFMPILVALSAFGTLSSDCFSAGRVAHAVGREGHICRFVSYVHYKTVTPIPGILLTGLLALLALILMQHVEEFIQFVVLVRYVFYIVTVGSLLVLKKTLPENEKLHLSLPWFVPVAFVSICLFIVITSVIGDPRVSYFYGLLYIVAGIVIYVMLYYCNCTMPFSDKMIIYGQLLLCVGPSHDPTLSD